MDKPGVIIIIIFLSYFALHSLMASLVMKKWVASKWPDFMPYYRFTFNGMAFLLSIPLVIVMFMFPGETLWQWQGVSFYLINGVALLALIAFVISLGEYDLSVFWGTRQIRERNKSVEDQECFHISTFHRYVRHPWYFFLLVIIWTRDISTTQLTVYSLVTLYLFVGSRLEERKLITYHGDVYRRYRKKVAGIVPLPWKILSVADADALLSQYQQER